MIVLIAKWLHREPKYRYVVTDRITTECTVKSLTTAEADSFRDRGYWVE